MTLLLLGQQARAELTIEITQGVDDPTAIAVVPFGWTGSAPSQTIAEIVSSDLKRSGLFEPLAARDMLSQPHTAKDVFFRDWQAVGSDFVVVGSVESSGGNVKVKYALLDVIKQQRLLSETLSGRDAQLRDIAHTISDRVYEKITGVRGAFATRILYVSAANRREKRHNYRLYMADADGARQRLIVESEEPLLSPTWAPNGREIAYVSFESGRPAIYRQNIATGAREKLTNFKGLNSAPSWSPDGSKLAMVLSKDGNPDIYVMDLATKSLRRLTRNAAIDTEPSWFPDGKSLVFTSDRGRKPQIYKVSLDGGMVERLTFEGNYNAKAQVLPDGSGLIMVHRADGKFHIAEQNFETDRVLVLTQTSLDESPSLAPNGRMVIYATQRNGRGVLGAVSTEGDIKYNYPATLRDLREPAWSPYLNK
jgi:TolB protein